MTELKLHIGLENGKSVVTNQYFTSPLKLGMPRAQGERLQVVLMMASAGILKGDCFQYEICCGQGSKTLLTEQSYSKIFDTGEGGARKEQTITVADNASLYYRPCAVIPFTGSTFDGSLQVSLQAHSEFAYADIVTAGRIGMGETFGFRHYRNRVIVFIQEDEIQRPVFLDHCFLEPKQMDLTKMTFFDGYTHQGTFYYYGSMEKEEKLCAFMEEETNGLMYGLSKALRGICIRVLAHTAQDIEELFEQIEKMLELDK